MKVIAALSEIEALVALSDMWLIEVLTALSDHFSAVALAALSNI